MASPKNPSSSTVTATEVRELLRTAAKSLSAREEKVVRMRAGAAFSKTQPLPRRGQGPGDAGAEARAELFALEAELAQKLAARAASSSKKAPRATTATRSKEKDKIVRALRRLK